MARDDDDRERRRRHRQDETSQERRERRDARRQRRKTGEPDDKRRSHTSSEEKRRSAATSKSRSPDKKPKRPVITEKYTDSSSASSSNGLSANALARLNAANEGVTLGDDSGRGARKVRSGQRRYQNDEDRYRHRDEAILILEEQRRKKREKPKARVVSDKSESSAEKGGSSFAMYKEKARRKKWWIIAGFALVALAIVIPVAVVESRKNMGVSGSSSSGAPTPGSTPDTLGGMSQADVPAWAKGTYYDPFTWYDTVDFNTTVTNDTVGGLPIMGLNSTWDDSAQANENVPALDKNFTYGTLPIRGVNVGGWLSIEPFITPSLFDQFPQSANVVDEWTLTTKLGATLAASQLEKHYSSWINKTSFEEIRDAGFDHVRIPYSYWAITTYDGDPYVKQISWRYLLRGIEYARQCGIRVNLDLHALPGSQNGWNHSGRQGVIGWLNGTDGDLNGQRALDIHSQLSTFFAQPRYKNVVTIYGLVNEPKMISLPTEKVINWTTTAIDTIRKNGVTALLSFGDGFLGLPKWKGQFPGEKNLILDAHQYVIFNTDQIAFDHKTKLNFACSGWQGQMQASMNTATGYGPTMCGEWSQADTDCATYLNNVNVGSRWEGTMNTGDPSANVLTATCPLKNPSCSCTKANADPSTYSDVYKQWLYNNAVAQMISFETGWGWFYWTWRTEKSPQWSWKLGLQAGILPTKVWDRNGTGPSGQQIYTCNGAAPDFSGLPESY